MRDTILSIIGIIIFAIVGFGLLMQGINEGETGKALMGGLLVLLVAFATLGFVLRRR